MRNALILLAICVLTIGLSRSVSANSEEGEVTNSYIGPFTNTTFNRGGDVTIDMTIHPDNTVSGYINFTEYPSVTPLCGAGDFNGTKTGNLLEFTFISQDPDLGCGFDWGWEFIVIATISRNNSFIEGNYYVGSQEGVFRVEIEWPDLSAIQANYDGKIGSNEAAFAHQFYCLASNSCSAYEETGDAGWAGEFVRYVFEAMIDENGLAKSLEVSCGSDLSNVDCFEQAAKEHRWELMSAFAGYCASRFLTGEDIDYVEWDDDHEQFLDLVVASCFDEVALAGELPVAYANDMAEDVQVWATFLRETVQCLCPVSDTLLTEGRHTSCELPPRPTEEELYIPSLEVGSTLSVTANEGFFLDVGSSVQIQVGSQNGDILSDDMSYEYEVIHADSSVATISSSGELTIYGTRSAIVVVPHLIQVRVTSGDDWGIGQFAIADVDSDDDGLVDSYEVRVGLDPNAANSLFSDKDIDGVNDVQEAMIGTLPRERDSDGDGFDDDIELLFNTDPLDRYCTPTEGCVHPVYLPVLIHP